MTDEELHFILDAIEEVIAHIEAWGEAYIYNANTNEFTHKEGDGLKSLNVASWFALS